MRNWEIKDVVSFQRLTGITVSPDGDKIVYSLRTLDEEEGTYREKLWHVASDGKSDPVQLTRGHSRDKYPVMSPDGQFIGFLSDRKQSSDDDEEDEIEHQLYLLPTGGGEAIYASESLSEIYDFVFSKDGTGVYVITDVEETPIDTYMRKSAEEDKRDVVHEELLARARRICHIALPSLEVTTIYELDYGLIQLAISDDGQKLVFVTNYTGLANDEDQSDLWMMEHQADADTWTTPSPLVQRDGACFMPSISPDGSKVAFVAPRETKRELSQADLFVIDMGTQGLRNLSAEIGFIGDVEGAVWRSDTELVAAVSQKLYSPIVKFNVAQLSYSYLTDETAVVATFSLTKSAAKVAYLQQTVENPDNVFVTSLDGGEPIQCTDLHKEFHELPRARVQRFTWTSEFQDGPREVEGILVLPNESMCGKGPYPLIVDIHGGPAGHMPFSYDASDSGHIHLFASRGYAIFLPNYRGTAGFGHEFMKATFEDLGGGDYQDIMRGLDAVIQTGFVDETRMGVMGGSYGGYMTNWIIGHDKRFKAAISEYGIWNLFTDFGCSSQRAWEMMYLGAYWNREELYLERSPARYVQNIETPVLIIHGDADDNTFISNSKEMYNALVEAGKTVEFLHYPREGHGVQEPRHRMDELRRMLAWFSHYIPVSDQDKLVPKGQQHTIQSRSVAMTVEQARYTSDYRHHGETFEQVLEVAIVITPTVPPEADEDVVELHLNDNLTSDFLLSTTAAEKHRRKTVFGAETLPPKAIVLAEGVLVTGDMTVTVTQEMKVRLLFVGSRFGETNVGDWHVYLEMVKFAIE